LIFGNGSRIAKGRYSGDKRLHNSIRELRQKEQVKLVVYGEGAAGFAIEGYFGGGTSERLDVAGNLGNSHIPLKVSIRKMEVGGRTYNIPKPKVGSFCRFIFFDEFIRSNKPKYKR
jgi:hypothetical protein